MGLRVSELPPAQARVGGWELLGYMWPVLEGGGGREVEVAGLDLEAAATEGWGAQRELP